MTILMVVAFLLPLALVGAMKAKTHNRNDVRGWLPIEYEETRVYREFREQFQGEEFILVSWEGCTLSDQRLELMARKLAPPTEYDPGAPTSLFKSVVTGPHVIERMTAEPLNLTREEAIERLTGSLVGPPRSAREPIDQRQTCLVVTLSDAGRKNLHRTVQRLTEVAQTECAVPPQDLHLGGPPVDNVAIDKAGQESLMVLLGLAFVVGSIVSWFSLRSGRLVAIVVVTGIYSMALSLAVVWYTGSPVDAIVLTMPSLVYVATTSGAIHLSNYYRDQVAESGTRVNAASKALRHAALPLGLATGTTAVGLLTLCYSELIPIQMFGIYSAVGVIVSLLLLVFLIPSALEAWPPNLKIGAAAKDESESETWKPPEKTRWWKVGQWIVDHNGLVATMCLAVMALVGYGITRAETSVQLMRLFSSRARILDDYRWLEERLGPLVPMEIVLHVDRSIHDDLDTDDREARRTTKLTSARTAGGDEDSVKRLSFLERIELVAAIQKQVETIDEVGSTLSTVTFIRDLDTDQGSSGGAAKLFGLNRRTKRSVLNKRLLAHREELKEGDYFREWDDPETGETKELWRISARVSALKNVDYAQFTNRLREVVEPILAERAGEGKAGLRVAYTGLIPLVYKAQHSLIDGLIFGFVTDFALIVIVMMVACRDWSAGLVLFLPSVFPALVVFGAIGWINSLLKSSGIGNMFIDIGTVMAPSVALGVTVDDVVHYLLWFRRGIQEGMTRKEAVMLANKGCARAMYQSWGVIGIGLAVFAFSPFGPTQRFGLMMLAMLTAALAGNLLLMPAILAGPLGALFAWGIRRKQRRAEAKAQASAGAVHELHSAEHAVIPQPHVQFKTVPTTSQPPIPAPHSPTTAVPKPAPPTASKTNIPAPHSTTPTTRPPHGKKPNAA